MSWWYMRPGVNRKLSLIVGLCVAASGLLRLIDQPDTSEAILSVLSVLAGLALVVSIMFSMKFDSRATRSASTSD